jgi:DMSO/TMAO reductase YedYZ molybdopterin-dependent catalytic subunit
MKSILYFTMRIALSFMFLFSCLLGCSERPAPGDSSGTLSVSGAVEDPRVFSITDLRELDSFYLKDVYLVKEKGKCTGEEELLSVGSYRGILLRDLLLECGMEFTRKWEPGVFIRARGGDLQEVVFSFGEIFYSSIGRSVLLAYEKDGKPISFSGGCGELIVSTDIRAGRRIAGITSILVDRVDVEMLAYKDKEESRVRPPTTQFSMLDHRTGQTMEVGPEILEGHYAVTIPAAILAGECEGFGGICSFWGTSLKDLLETFGITGCPAPYNRYVLVASEDGFCAVFSMGELFNSRLGDHIVIAYEKNDALLNEEDGFAMSVVGEDSTGGRSVKRIQRIEVF